MSAKLRGDEREPNDSPPTTVEVRLHEVAHARTGDKGNRLNVAVIPYHEQAYPYIVEQITEERVLALFSHRGATCVTRYELPKLPACNYVIDDVLEGGVNASLNLDGHGKTLSSLVLTLSIRVPAHLALHSPQDDRSRANHRRTA